MRALGAVLVLACAPLAYAQDSADRAYADGRFDDAARLYADALATPGREAAELVHARMRLGELRALAGDEAGALAHFEIALALDPLLDPPEALVPALRARFEALRQARDGRRVSVRIETQEGVRRAVVHDAPAGLVSALRVRGAGGFMRRLAFAGEPIAIEAPASAEPISLEALDAQDQVVARAGVRPALPAVTLAPAEPAPANSLAIFESPWFWIVAGAIVIGVAIAIGLSASGDRWTLGAPVLR